MMRKINVGLLFACPMLCSCALAESQANKVQDVDIFAIVLAVIIVAAVLSSLLAIRLRDFL